MYFDPSKYNYVIRTRQDGVKEVIALSTYAKKTVKGVAKCDPRDQFDGEKGKQLAASRCNAHVARLRVARARRKFNEAMIALDKAKEYYRDMAIYLEESKNALEWATQDLDHYTNTY